MFCTTFSDIFMSLVDNNHQSQWSCFCLLYGFNAACFGSTTTHQIVK